ncbi:MAG TPA: YEATS-associated helix-containing protein [Rhizomicrobium sp.]|jgi:DNA-binding MarR family transcriptional regulator|nr:YEATS-associated helix-containing protein [Rhizomicrobium sp.]
MIWIIPVMLVAGLFGGGAGHLSSPAPQSGDDQPSKPTWLADLVIGIVAALCVPIFLQITQSKLMDSLWTAAQSGRLPDLDLLYLGGFCLIAAFSSRTFLQSVSSQVIRETRQEQKVLRAEQEKLKAGQNELQDNVADLGEAVDPSDPQESNVVAAPAAAQIAPAHLDDLKNILASLSQPEKRVLSALANEKYARRSLTGTAKDAGLSRAETSLALEGLIDRDLAIMGRGKRTESLLYELTPKGRRAAAML